MERLSVVTVSDYEPGQQKTWNDERKLLLALADQDLDQPYELILVESEQARGHPLPAELASLVGGLKVLYHPATRSAELKDYGVSQSSGTFVAVLESDCVPSRNWLRVLLAAMEDGDHAAASGRTYYGDGSSYRRVLNLLHRSWDDHGHSSATPHVSNNGAIYRREILERFPYPDAATPFLSAELRNNAILQSGERFYFQREARMQHAVGGLGFLWDYQRNKGHQRMAVQPKQSWWQLPGLVAAKVGMDLSHARRLGADYLRWYDWPLLPVLMLLEIPPFIVGALDAVARVEQIPGSAYR